MTINGLAIERKTSSFVKQKTLILANNSLISVFQEAEA
jgi:hypothetical protein